MTTKVSTTALKRSARRSRWVRFLRGIGWTLLGLVALVLMLAVLGMIIPPPRDPKAKALDNEDFGLGFKVGDKWDPAAMDSAIEAGKLPLRTNYEIWPDLSSNRETKTDEMNFADWYSEALSLHVIASSSEGWRSVIVYGIYITTNSPDFDYFDYEALAIESRRIDEIKAMFPGDNAKQYAYLRRTDALYVRERHPGIKTSQGITYGSSLDDVINAYGRPTFQVPYGDYVKVLCYFGDGSWVYFAVSLDCVFRYGSNWLPNMNTPIGRLQSWGIRAQNWFSYKIIDPITAAMKPRKEEGISVPKTANFDV